MEPTKQTVPPAVEHPQSINASVGAILSIAIILTMIIVGAFYSWGERISQQRAQDALFTTKNSVK
jgi:hypothetical protein